MLEEINNLQESQLRQATMEQNLNSGQGAQVDANGNLVDTATGNTGPGNNISPQTNNSKTSNSIRQGSNQSTGDTPVKIGKGGFRSGGDLATRLANAKKRRAQLQQNAASLLEDKQTEVFDALIGAAKEIVKNG
jgi:hypothetical protein